MNDEKSITVSSKVEIVRKEDYGITLRDDRGVHRDAFRLYLVVHHDNERIKAFWTHAHVPHPVLEPSKKYTITLKRAPANSPATYTVCRILKGGKVIVIFENEYV